MRIDLKIVSRISLGYIYIPIILFLFGWTKIWIALLCTAAIGFTGYRLFFRKGKDQDRMKDDLPLLGEEIRISTGVVVASVAMILVFLYYSGVGRFVWQSYDWYKHNAILSDLTSRSWPVYYHNNGDTSMLTYYLAQYLLPGLIGKATGSFRVAEIAYFFLGAAGIFLVWCHVILYAKIQKKHMQILTVCFLFFFSAPNMLRALVFSLLFRTNITLEWYSFYLPEQNIVLQYTDNYDLIRYVLPQSVSIWLIFLLFLEKRKNLRNYVFILLPGVFFGIFPFLGFLPFALGQAIIEFVQRKEKKTWLREVFSPENISVAATLGVVLFLYYLGNVLTPKPDSFGLTMTPFSGKMQYYVVYVLVTVILPMSFVFMKHRKDVFYYIVLGLLLILPFFRMGKYNDLMMRTSIPALFLLMLYMLGAVNDMKKRKPANMKTLADFAMVLVIVIGMIMPFLHLLERLVEDDITEPAELLSYGSLEYLATRDDETFIRSYEEAGFEYKGEEGIWIYDDLRYNYFTYDPEESLFYKYIAREKDRG